MKKIFNFIFLMLFFSENLLAKSEYLKEGINLFEKKKYNEAKFKF